MPRKRKKMSRREAAKELTTQALKSLSKLPEEEQDRRVAAFARRDFSGSRTARLRCDFREYLMRSGAEPTRKDVMRDLLDGVERELRPSAPARVRATLKAFRQRLDAKRIRGGQERFERQLEALLQKDPFLKAAAKRHLEKEARKVLKATIAALKRAKAVIEKYRKQRVQASRRTKP